MDEQTRCRAMVAMCRQHAKIAGENGAFWLAEAERWAELLAEIEAGVVIDFQERLRQKKDTS